MQNKIPYRKVKTSKRKDYTIEDQKAIISELMASIDHIILIQENLLDDDEYKKFNIEFNKKVEELNKTLTTTIPLFKAMKEDTHKDERYTIDTSIRLHKAMTETKNALLAISDSLNGKDEMLALMEAKFLKNKKEER